MPVTFVRSLGHQPGVQLNPLVDPASQFQSVVVDQTFGIAMRSTRGRIDRAFTINFNDMVLKLGKGEPIRMNPLNEAWAHVYEALNISGGHAVVSRLVNREQAKIKWVIYTDSVRLQTAEGYDVQDADLQYMIAEVNGQGGAGYVASPNPLNVGYMFQFQHLGCHNDGIKISIWSEPNEVNGTPTPSKKLRIRLYDADDNLLHHFMGSTDPNARDEYGNSAYLPDVVETATDEVILQIEPNLEFDPSHPAYGFDQYGVANWQTSDVIIAFEEGDNTYSLADYLAAMDRLRYSKDDFFYLVSGGSRSVALLIALSNLAIEQNKQLRFDVPGDNDVTAAITFVDDLQLKQNDLYSHLFSAFWMPVKSDDMSKVNPTGFLGAATLNVAMACRRNGQRNARGLAPMHYPIAGRANPIKRTGLRQPVPVSEKSLSDLARARVNPVIFDTFNDGSFCVFRDQLTLETGDTSLCRLISVIDMSTSIDDRVVRYGKSLLNSFPMAIAISKMRSYLADLFRAAETTGWLVPSTELNGATHRFAVVENAERPYDKMDVTYVLRYDGALRQIVVTQSIAK